MWCSGKLFCKNAPMVGAVSHALQAPPFPLRLCPFLPPPLLLRQPAPFASSYSFLPTFRGAGSVRGVEERLSHWLSCCLPSRRSGGGGRERGSWLLGASVTLLLLPSWGLRQRGPLALRSHLCSLALPLPRWCPLPRWSVIRSREVEDFFQRPLPLSLFPVPA